MYKFITDVAEDIFAKWPLDKSAVPYSLHSALIVTESLMSARSDLVTEKLATFLSSAPTGVPVEKS